MNIVGEFESVIRDVQAARGILICHSGFTKKAKEYAANIKIDLKIQHSYIPMGNISLTELQIPFPEDSFNSFMQAWEEGSIPKTPGKHYFDFDPGELDFSKEFITYKSRIENM